MKKLIFYVIFAVFFTSLIHATDWDQLKKKGVMVIMNAGMGFNLSGGPNILALHIVTGYQFSRNLSAGFGAGAYYSRLNSGNSGLEPVVIYSNILVGALTFPAYADFRYYMFDGKFSPYFLADAGGLLGVDSGGFNGLFFLNAGAGIRLAINSGLEILLEVNAPFISGKPGIIIPMIGLVM